MNPSRGPTLPIGLGSVVLILSALTALDCSTAPHEDDTGRVSQALASTIDVTLGFPAGWSQDKVALYGVDGVTIWNNVAVKDTAGNPAVAMNVGPTALVLWGGASTGTVVSGGTITIKAGAQVTGDAHAAGAIDPAQPPVTGQVLSNTPIGTLSNFGYTVKYPNTTSKLQLDGKDSADLKPNVGYENVTLHSKTTAKLSAGTYYIDTLETEPETTLDLNTSNGPIMVHVRGRLNFKGKLRLTGPSGRFLLGYYGTDATSIESPFNGTIVAPNAALRLAPAGTNPGHRGSFFAKRLEGVEAGSLITFEPFSFWYKLVDVRPVATCVRRYQAPFGSALFGYENPTGVAVTIPLGAANTISPAAASPPIVLEPGPHPRALWVPFDLTQSATWALAGQTAVASSSTRLCGADDTIPTPPRATEPIFGDSPDLPGPTTMARMVPDVRSPASSSLAAPVKRNYFQPTQAPARPATPSGTSTGPIGSLQQPLEDGDAGTGPFTFEITSLTYNGDEGLCGTVDPYVSRLVINGTDFGRTGSATVEIPRSQRTVPVHVHVMDSDSLLCLGDDDLADVDIDVDNTHNDQKCLRAGDGDICWRATTSGSPAICFDWNAQFLDAGPWSGVDSEDFAPSKGVQHLPASFATVSATIERQGSKAYEYTGPVDKDGCIPSSKLPEANLWSPGANSVVRLSLLSQFCVDPTGAACQPSDKPSDLRFGGASIVVLAEGATGPTRLCTIFAEDPASVADSGCVVKPLDWTDRPASPLRPAYDDQNPVTRSAAGVSQILARDDETGGELGVATALMVARLELDHSDQGLLVRAEEYCCLDGEKGDPCNGPNVKRTTCAQGPTLLLEPDNKVPAASRFKYTVAHEFGHFVQVNVQGTIGHGYGDGAGIDGQPPLCRCNSVVVDDQLHCLQSLELPGAAELEGFAQFFASKVWNRGLENNCTYVYYKNFDDTACLPGVEDCAPSTANPGLFTNKPPIPVACNVAVRWRNTHCVDSSSSVDVLQYGTEYDWMEFFYAINNARDSAERWIMADIFNAYLAACSDSYDPKNTRACVGTNVTWTGAGKDGRSLVKGAQASAGGPQSRMARSFADTGDQYGVSERP